MSISLHGASQGNDDRLTRIFQHFYLLTHKSCYLSCLPSRGQCWPLPPQFCRSCFCVVLFIRRLRKDSVLFPSYNKIAKNANDSKTALCSQRITCQNIEGADFSGGNSAAPFVLTGTSSSLLPEHKAVFFFFPHWKSLPVVSFAFFFLLLSCQQKGQLEPSMSRKQKQWTDQASKSWGQKPWGLNPGSHGGWTSGCWSRNGTHL